MPDDYVFNPGDACMAVFLHYCREKKCYGLKASFNQIRIFDYHLKTGYSDRPSPNHFDEAWLEQWGLVERHTLQTSIGPGGYFEAYERLRSEVPCDQDVIGLLLSGPEKHDHIFALRQDENTMFIHDLSNIPECEEIRFPASDLQRMLNQGMQVAYGARYDSLQLIYFLTAR